METKETLDVDKQRKAQLKRIGQRLKSGMVDRGLSTAQFAENIGRSPATVKEWCVGRVGMSLENAVLVCDALDWPLDRLACRDKETTKAGE